ncbi:MAG: hypothetical protein IH856_18290 [Deltaproteobacteria bacterium]|nr:hypothetical protein [Deltaproteobacteria bacterium]
MIDQHLCLGVASEGGAGLLSRALSEAGKSYLKWKARNFERQARGWTGEELESALGLMRRADWRAKSGVTDRLASPATNMTNSPRTSDVVTRVM